VLSVLDTPTGPAASAHPVALPTGPISIEFREVSFAYGSRIDTQDDDLPVLKNISLKVPSQQHIALVGASGSGKTTLARLIARFADPTIGAVLLSGVNLREIDNDLLRQRLVVVPQEPFLFAQTIAYNLLFARPQSTNAELISAFDRLELGDWIRSLPKGLETNVGQRGSSLSAGERQLIALARAALTNPDVLVLDEATSAVDALTEVQLARALNVISAGRTTVSIAHRLSTASRADRILVLENGVIVEDGSHLELMTKQGNYFALYQQWLASSNSQMNL
jgi:putative ABC transport system ATP-binding protein